MIVELNLVHGRERRLRRGKQARADPHDIGRVAGDHVFSDARRRNSAQLAAPIAPFRASESARTFDTKRPIRRDADRREHAGARGVHFREAGLRERDLHEVRDENREANAIRERRAIGVEKEMDIECVALASFQNERPAVALREDFVAELREGVVLRFSGARGLIHEDHIVERDVLEHRRIAPPVDRPRVVMFVGDEFLQTLRD